MRTFSTISYTPGYCPRELSYHRNLCVLADGQTEVLTRQKYRFERKFESKEMSKE